jgi:head-tail adaptor
MRAGRLDRRMTIQRKSIVLADSGEQIESWASLSTNRPASVTPVSGTERFGGEAIESSQQVEFRIRWSQNVADLSPLDRIVYPSFDALDSQSLGSSVYDVLAVNEIGRHEVLQIITARRPDVLQPAYLVTEIDEQILTEDGQSLIQEY